MNEQAPNDNPIPDDFVVGMPGETGFMVPKSWREQPAEPNVDKLPQPEPSQPEISHPDVPEENVDLARQAVSEAFQTSQTSETLQAHKEGLSGVLQHAARLGIDEPKLKQFRQMLQMQDIPPYQRTSLTGIIKRDNLHATADELLHLTRNYQKESIKSGEKGNLYHYHQTDIENLNSILEQGALLSHNEQKKLGIAGSAAGSRPDVVQMTRDKYDAAGKLIEAGIKDTSSGLGVSGGVAFIFNQSVMDDPEYDSLGRFPNVPGASLDKLKAVAVGDKHSMADVKQTFAAHGINAEIVTRSEWISRYGQEAARNSY